MHVISVPFFVGRFMDAFEVPQPAEVVKPPLPHDGVHYDTSRAVGPDDVGQQRMAALYAELATRVAASSPTIVYAGDCLSVIGTLAGLQRKGIDPTLYWFDAHGDFNTWETTGSNFLGGMPLAMITGRGEQTIVTATGMRPLADGNIVLVDGRDLDPGEDEAIAASGMTVKSVEQVAVDEPRPGPIYVHVDVDVADPADLPAINYPAPDGPSADSVRAAVDRLAESGRVVAASVSSWNPALPEAARAASTTRSMMGAFLDQ
ncbi:MAG: arginase family protein [Actinobacteria bacterium]|nr:arginase family protein [Actinomycetota bacterium]